MLLLFFFCFLFCFCFFCLFFCFLFCFCFFSLFFCFLFCFFLFFLFVCSFSFILLFCFVSSFFGPRKTELCVRCDPDTINCMPLSLRNGAWRNNQALIGPNGRMASWMLGTTTRYGWRIAEDEGTWSSIALEDARISIPIEVLGGAFGEAQKATTKRTKREHWRTAAAPAATDPAPTTPREVATHTHAIVLVGTHRCRH